MTTDNVDVDGVKAGAGAGSPTASVDDEVSLPQGLSRPARRALVAAGFTRLDQFTRVSAADIGRLHGVGPKAVDLLRLTLAGNGLSFAGEG
ncbi:hypothetical protein [Microtetraspora niveoalba]|uniref:hypothetical protein n=1 Tax=Microtetraspora niveoalba TaxID=46175 RepID=UPI000A823CB3|nr:hypothetical protein [Microtetraspora niveoalba]